ncbi:hypothetical protein B7486_14890 [cyanobacterium TDX16]|nr:hypothetical protein B7486_14890 [cyanobacterium TDX16]
MFEEKDGRMRRHLLLTSILAAGLASPATAGVKIGDEAPAISAGSWFNLPKGIESLTPAHLKGQIVMVEFWATW